MARQSGWSRVVPATVMIALVAVISGLQSKGTAAQDVGSYLAKPGPMYDPFDNDPYLDGYNRPILRSRKGYRDGGRWCHLHKQKVRGMKRHAKRRCHKHGRPYHPSIKYVY